MDLSLPFSDGLSTDSLLVLMTQVIGLLVLSSASLVVETISFHKFIGCICLEWSTHSSVDQIIVLDSPLSI